MRKYTIRSNFVSAPVLFGNPQKRGTVLKLTTMTPKKPNSAIRHVAKLRLTNNRFSLVRLPGKGFLCVKFNKLLIRGGRANDLPGIRCSAIRGVLDFPALFFKKKRRSIYGTSRPANFTSHVKRSLRKLGYN